MPDSNAGRRFSVRLAAKRHAAVLASLVLLSGCDALFGTSDYTATLRGDVQAVREGDGILDIGLGAIGHSSHVKLGDRDGFLLDVSFSVDGDTFPPPDATASVRAPGSGVSAVVVEPALRPYPDIPMEGTITTQCVGSRLTGSFSLSSVDAEIDLSADGTFDIPRHNADQYPCG